MSRALILGLVVTVIALADHAHAAEWVDLSESTNGTVWAVDASSVVIGRRTQNVWIRSTLKKPDADGAVSTTWRYQISCDASTYTILAALSHRADGTVSYSKTFASYEQKVELAAPDTVSETIVKAICAASNDSPAKSN
jgi:hypothetical protein